jgi:alkylhydroperoxidase/carboxymuconolactone decarboxylase family protein YurZ
MANAQRTKRLIAKMRKARGYLYPEWELVAREAPEFFEAYDALYEQALNSGRGLTIKHRELVALAILAFRGAGRDAIANHIRRAYRHGATRAEVLGAFEATVMPGGGVTFLNGIRALADVEASLRRRPRRRAR